MNSYLTFIGELPTYFKEIGSVCPSSPFLAKKLLETAPDLSRPRRILEVGSGTGALTKKILESMKPQDSLVLYELNTRFTEALEELVRKSGVERSRVKIVNADIRELTIKDEADKFDLIFSGLPFLNFKPEMVREILSVFRQSLVDDGAIIYFGYLALGKLCQPFRSKSERERIQGVQSAMAVFCSEASEHRVEKVFLNIPPAHGTMVRFQTV